MPYRPPSPHRPAQPPAPLWLFVGTPAHKCDVHTNYLTSILRLFDAVHSAPPEERWKLSTSAVAGGGVAKARNNLSWEFLTNTKAQFILMADNDMFFQPGDVKRLIDHNVDIVGGLYSHKNPVISWCAKAIPGVDVDPKTGLQEMQAVGTGFLLIKRGVFEKMRAAHPEIEYVEDWAENKGTKHWDFFSEGVVKDEAMQLPEPTYLTEDWYFCYRARKLGFKVLLDTQLLIKHCEGITRYPLESALKALETPSG